MKLSVTVDSRIRMPLVGIQDPARAEILRAFTYPNPEYTKAERMKAAMPWIKLPPKMVATWEMGGGELSLPRGGMSKLREVLRANGVAYCAEDKREQGEAAALPWNGSVTLYDFQEASVAAGVKREQGIIRSPTGCIVGEAMIGVNRAGKGSRRQLRHVVRMFNGGSVRGPRWEPSILTMVRAPFADGTVRLARLLSATVSGVREVYRLRVVRGDGEHGDVVATADHRFLTPYGWRRLDELDAGDYVLVEGGKREGTKAKPWYKLRACREHPHAGRRGVRPDKGGWTVPEHRLVAEADLNGFSDLGAFMQRVAARAPMKFLDPKKWVVHHKNENPRDNRLENLEVLTHAEHRARHRQTSVENITHRLIPAEVYGIEYVGERETFDLEVEDASAFMANGVAVHNSGKTETAIALASRLGVRTLVVVPSKALLDQWVRRLAKSLAIGPGDIGIIGGGKRKNLGAPIVVGMAATLYLVDDAVLAPFGAVILDEAQRAAARIFFEVIDRVPARYRFAFSADERRKDRKEFLTYDLFGEVIAEVSRKELEDRGIVHDVELRVVPTAFRAPWYEELDGQDRAAPENYRRLLEELVADKARNALAASLAVREAKEGETVLVFSLRVEHCRVLRADIAKREPRAGLLVGDASAGEEDDFERTREGLASGEIRIGVGTYQAAGTGVDLPSVSRGICTTPIHTNRQFFGQVRGRICRVDRSEGAEKTDACLYYLWDREIHGLSALRSLTGWTRRAVVLVDGKWVEAKKWLREQEARNEEAKPDRTGWFPGFGGGAGG